MHKAEWLPKHEIPVTSGLTVAGSAKRRFLGQSRPFLFADFEKIRKNLKKGNQEAVESRQNQTDGDVKTQNQCGLTRIRKWEIYLKEYAKELINALQQYFEFYNFGWPHESPEGKTPGEVYFGESIALRAA